MVPGVRRVAVTAYAVALTLVLAVSAVLILQSPSETSADGVAGTPEESDWTASWGAALTAHGGRGRSVTGFEDATLRQVVHLSIGADTLRLRFSNAYGDRPLELGTVTVGLLAGEPGTPDLVADSSVPVTFGGESSATLAPGRRLASDPVPMGVPDGADLVVSTYLPEPTGPTTWQSSAFASSFVAVGDATADEGAAYRVLGDSRYYLAGVDVVDDADEGAVVFVGDSITAGSASTVDANRRYPDVVADRLLSGEGGRRCGVVNAGVGGNRVLTGSGSRGESLTDRFTEDVLAVPGVRTVVVLAGINDVGSRDGGLDPRVLEDAHTGLVRRAHAAGLRVVGATLLPFGGAGYATPAAEADRRDLNRWMRVSGTYDDVVDLDRVVRDSRDPWRLWPAYDSGDHLHPNDAGFAAMAGALDLDSLC